MATALLRRPVRDARRAGRERPALNGQTIAGALLAGVLLLAGLLAPLIATGDPLAQTAQALHGPGTGHLLGTDEFGRDLFSRVVYGLRQDAFVALLAVPVGGIVGTALGLLGAVTRRLDVVMQRCFDVMLAFTALVMGVTVAAILGPGLRAVILTVALVNVPLFGRLARSAVLGQRHRDYVVAAEVLGVPRRRVIFRHILPNVLDGLIVQAALSLSTAVFIEGAMSFAGIGVTPPQPSLGSLLRTSILFLDQNPAYALGPIVVVTLLVCGFQLLADGLGKGLLRR
ncbi:MAG: ABC transporter permease [Motilibacteraceae bacterium]